ncbi:hypothetical protein niasHT_006581 [Heterodera trifolii]|uniref:Transmembrane protein n=1 Tax=Heterodera trifolii TaxID=157864 RepID=A0ABD2M7J0_9BILA
MNSLPFLSLWLLIGTLLLLTAFVANCQNLFQPSQVTLGSEKYYPINLDEMFEKCHFFRGMEVIENAEDGGKHDQVGEEHKHKGGESNLRTIE